MIVFFSILTGLLYLATPLAVDSVVQNIAFGGQQKVYVQTLLIFSFVLLVFLALSSLITAAQHFVTELIQQRIFVRLSADMAYRLPRLRCEALETSNTPELINRFLDVTTVQKSCAVILLDGVNVTLSGVIGLLVLAFYHPFLLGFNFVLIALLCAIVFLLGRQGVATSVNESYAKHALAGWFEQVVMFPTSFKGPGGPAFSLLRAHAIAGRPFSGTYGGYEEWNTVVRGALVWAGAPDPYQGVGQLAEVADERRTAMQALLDNLEVWLQKASLHLNP
jgi:ABC-type multidrug transport system fused ATPase/permease subunit